MTLNSSHVATQLACGEGGWEPGYLAGRGALGAAELCHLTETTQGPWQGVPFICFLEASREDEKSLYFGIRLI